MEKTPHKETYILQLDRLIGIIDTTNERIISETPDKFFQDNANFFTKSFLVIMCAYLESYLKDALMVIVDSANEKLTSNSLPHNLIKWSLNIEKEFKKDDSKIEHFKIKIKKKELDEFISGHPYRTIDLFNKFGISLEKDTIFNGQKDIIKAIVVKRNNVIHHNDDASDISNDDLKKNIKGLTEYIINIDKLICLQV